MLLFKQSIGYKLFGYYSLDASIIGIADGVQIVIISKMKLKVDISCRLLKEVVTEVLKLLNAEVNK